MTSRTWIGGGNDNAGNPNDWSPNGAPQPGDQLDMQAGTMNVRDDNLAGNTLTIGASQTTDTAVTLNLSHHADVSLDTAQFSTSDITVNVRGADTLKLHTEFPGSSHITVSLADHASLTGAFSMTFSSAIINGGDDTRFVNNGVDLIEGSSLTFGTDVKGHGSIAVSSVQSIGGQLEFGGSVSRGQDISVIGDPERFRVSTVQVDHPDDFKGAVALNVFGEVDLLGLSGADSYQFKNDILSIYSGCDVIEKLRLTTPPVPPFTPGTFDLTVAQTSAGIVIDRGSFNGNGTLLPMHG